MRQLTKIGLRRKTIFIRFLKKEKIMGDVIGNYSIASKMCKLDTNDIFNNSHLSDLINLFFNFHKATYPKNIKGKFEKVFFWEKIQRKWLLFIFAKEYEKYEKI